MRKRWAGAAVAAIALAVPSVSAAHPDEAGERYVPWADDISQQQSVKMLQGDMGAAAAAPAAPGAANMALVGNSDKDGTVNTDLAFWGDLAYAGNYDGFRILDVKGQQPRVVVDFKCRGPQNDVSVYELGRKRFLFQSIDSGQTQEDCASADAPLIGGTNRVGYEGVRVFDVTNPTRPEFVDMIQTACGSHTHTLVPDGKKAYIYVSSYPLGSGVTPPGVEGPGDYRPCTTPHKKISVIEVSARRGNFSYRLKEQPLSDDTTPTSGFQACHDIQVFTAKDLAVGACAGDAQLWSVKDPWNPTTDVEGRHTHIRSPSATDQFEFIHSGVVSWDGKTFAIMDETGGGGTAECDGDASDDGFYYFYDVVKPGAPAPPLRSRYTIPRPQTPEICVSHNGNVIPVKGRNLMVAAYYQGGNTVVDFTNPARPREIGYSDLEDTTGAADSWSTYWYNGRAYANGGLNRRGATANRGLDVFELTGEPGRAARGAARWRYSNPQTQEAWQAPRGRGWGRD
jgi:hypothetical protein